jgi:hypothetical protein
LTFLIAQSLEIQPDTVVKRVVALQKQEGDGMIKGIERG